MNENKITLSGRVFHGIDVLEKVERSLDWFFSFCFSPLIQYHHQTRASTVSVLMARWCVAGVVRYQSAKR